MISIVLIKRWFSDHQNRFISVLLMLLWMNASTAIADMASLPRADVHLHYKWNQIEVTDTALALDYLEHENIVLAAVIGTPPALALELQQKAPGKILSWYGVYQEPGDWSRWMYDKTLPARARKAVTTGGYSGIGELHLIGGFAPRWDSPVIAELLDISAETGAPLLIHVEFSKADYLIGLCQHQSKAKLLLAHAGAPLKASEAKRALDACPGLWWELSARDTYRYVGSPILDKKGYLTEQWKALILDYSNRLMLGSDPVWPVEQMNPWEEPDTGWEMLGAFWQSHERWLKQLPESVAQNIRLENARRFFRRDITNEN